MKEYSQFRQMCYRHYCYGDKPADAYTARLYFRGCKKKVRKGIAYSFREEVDKFKKLDIDPYGAAVQFGRKMFYQYITAVLYWEGCHAY